MELKTQLLNFIRILSELSFEVVLDNDTVIGNDMY